MAAAMVAARPGNPFVRTVAGDVKPESLGFVQPHEHVFINLIGYADVASKPPEAQRSFERDRISLDNYYEARWNYTLKDDLVLDSMDDAVREIGAFASAGGGTIVDPTPIGTARDPQRLREVSAATGVQIVMGTSYYIASFHPPAVAHASEDEIRERFVDDIQFGADGTDIKAGIVGEIGMSWPTHPDEEKVLRAGTAAAVSTGAPLMVHVGRGQQAPMDHCDVVEKAGGDLSRTVLSHLDRTIFTIDDFRRLGERGVNLSFDLFGEENSLYYHAPIDMPNDGRRIDLIRQLIDDGFGDQIVIAQDIARRTRLSAYGGEGYAHLVSRVVPQMIRKGMTQQMIDMITRTNPQRILTFGPPARPGAGE